MDFREGEGKEPLQKGEKTFLVFSGRDGLDFVQPERTADRDLVDQGIVAIETEFEEVGQDEVWKGVAVAFELTGCFDLVEVFDVRFLGFNVADDMLFAVPDPKIGISRLGLLG